MSEQITTLLGGAVTNIKQLTTLICLVSVVVQGYRIVLSQLATFLPGDVAAESHVTRLRRLMMNLHVGAWVLYRSMLTQVLA